ncbi:MAG: GNAT family N-acetyltransferase [Bacillota bacterium]|nr:GNAT family N-acetyltransferase [Bacillota bacterium]
MTIQFRQANIEDIPVLVELRKLQLIDEGQCEHENIDAELLAYFTKQFEANTMVEWVAEDKHTIVATAAMTFIEFLPAFTNPSGIKGYVTNMYTSKEYRGRSLATKMLGKLMEEAKSRNVHTILFAASKMGEHVYKKFGFEKADEWMIYHL